jgi:hypothetical protein
MQIHTIGNHIANVYADPKSDSPIGGLIAIVLRHLLLDSDRAAHGSFNAVEHDEQRVACGLNDPPAVLGDRPVDQSAAKRLKPCERSNVVQPNQAAVTNHVGMNYGDQLPPA